MASCEDHEWSKPFIDKYKEMSWEIQECKKCGKCRKPSMDYTYFSKRPSRIMKEDEKG